MVIEASPDASLITDAVSVLTSAGFRAREARAAVAAAAGAFEGDATLECLIRAALGYAASSVRCREAGPTWLAWDATASSLGLNNVRSNHN